MPCLICGGYMRLVSRVDVEATLDNDNENPFRIEQQLERTYWHCTDCGFEHDKATSDP